MYNTFMKTYIKKALKKYGIDDFIILKKLNYGYINNVWLIKINNNTKLVIKQRNTKTEKRLVENIQLVDYLKNKGFPVIDIISNLNGEKITNINNYNYELSKFINGKHPSQLNLKINDLKEAVKIFYKLDRTLVNLPKKLLQFPKAKIYSKEEVLLSIKIYKSKINKQSIYKKKILINFIDTLAEYINNDNWDIYNFKNLPSQVTHGNLSDNNIILDRSKKIISIIDWDNIRIRPRIHSISHQALTFSGKLNNQFIDKFSFYIKYYSKFNKIKKEELMKITPYMYYRVLNSIWVLDHILNNKQPKSYQAIPIITKRLLWFKNNHEKLQSNLLKNFS